MRYPAFKFPVNRFPRDVTSPMPTQIEGPSLGDTQRLQSEPIVETPAPPPDRPAPRPEER